MSGLLAADSFLVAEGKVRGLDLHRDRFTGTCAALGVRADAFWDESVQRLPRAGRWFPRFELHAGGELAMQVRPAPPTVAAHVPSGAIAASTTGPAPAVSSCTGRPSAP